jgi:hypothetical protein
MEVFMDNDNKADVIPPAYGRGAHVCTAPQAWSCTITCVPGTRFEGERLFDAPGAEVCVVTQCACRDNGIKLPQGAGELADSTLPLALVVFGVQYLMGLR